MHKKCWGKHQVPHDRYSGIIYSYVGSKYDETRLLVIGINNRANEGWINKNSESLWISKYAEEIRQKGKAFKFYDNVAKYATVWLTRNKYLEGSLEHNIDNSEVLAGVLENCIAFAQAVKCNPPKTTRQNPYNLMYVNCPSLILKEELDALKPRRILVLGLPNFDRIRSLIEEEMGFKLKRIIGQKVRRVEFWQHANEIDLIGVYHPSLGPTGHVLSILKSLNLP